MKFHSPCQQKLHVVHDEDDKVVPWSHGVAVAKAAPRSSLRTTAGLGHRDLLTDPSVRRRGGAGRLS